MNSSGDAKAGVKSTEFWVLAAPIVLDKLKGLDAGIFTSDQIVLMVLAYIVSRTVVKVARIVMAGFYPQGE